MNTIKLNEKEQKLFTLCIVKSCLEYAKDNEMDFEEVLTDYLFPDKASEDFDNMICKGIETLYNEKYISGDIEIVYEEECDMETMEWKNTDNVDVPMCTFIDVEITAKGENYLKIDGFKETTKDFLEKARPIMKLIGTVAIETLVESIVVSGLKAVGFPV